MQKVILMGTPEFAVPAFEALIKSELYSIPFIVTQEDKASGRGLEVKSPPVKELAQKYGIPVLQPASLKGIALGSEEGVKRLTTNNELNADFVAALDEVQPDAFVVIAYGKILNQALLDFPRMGAINVHASLLPRWRGAAPIQAALLHGDKETGVCLMKLEKTLDTGPVYCSSQISLSEDECFGELHDRLSLLGKDLLETNLEAILSGRIHPTAQTADGITFAAKIEPVDLEIDWSDPADAIKRKICAFSPLPGARTKTGDKRIKIFKAKVYNRGQYKPSSPGLVVEVNKAEIITACGNHSFLSLQELQLEGKKKLPAEEIIKGRGIKSGDIFE